MKFRYIALVGTVFLLIGAFVFDTPQSVLGQNSSVSTMNPWKLVSGVISPRSDTADIKIPSLASSGDCLVTDASGNITATACGTGSYPDYLSQVGDVSTTSLATGYVLKWSGTEWESVATSTLNISATALLTPWTSTINGAGFSLINAGDVTATSFTSTSTTANVFPNASTTNMSATGVTDLTTLRVSGLSTLTNASTTYTSATRFFGDLTGTASGNLISGGTLTTNYHCRYDGTGIDCDRVEDASGACGTNAVCMGGHTHVGVNETYGSGWDADTATPEKDDVYDWGHLFDTDDDGKVDVVDTTFGVLMAGNTGILTASNTPTVNTITATSTTATSTLPQLTGSYISGYGLSACVGTANKVTWSDGTFRCETDQAGGTGTSHATSSITVCALSTCDYVTDGTADEVQINLALSQASSTGGVVQLFAQTYNVSSAILLRGLTANSVSNPAISLYGMGQDATNIVGAPNINVIEITNEPKFNIANMTLSIKGTGDGINQVAGTERGNWLSHIDNVNIISDFTTVTSDSWGIYMESPFRMRFTNIEMNGVANGMWLKGHTDAFNPGNLSADRIFIDLWNDASVSGAIGIKLSNSGTSGTNHFNLTSWNRVDVQGGSALTSSVGIQLVGATGSYGETRQNDFNNMNIEDVKTAFELTDSSDNSFTNINYTRVLNGGTVFKLNSESINNRFENTYWDTATAGATFVLIDDSGNNSAEPNIFSRITGWSTGTTNLNVTLADSSVLEHIALTGGDPILEAELKNRIDRIVPSYIATASTTATSTLGAVEASTFGIIGKFFASATQFIVTVVANFTAGFTAGGNVDMSTATVKQDTYPGFTFSSSTAFVGTTTKALPASWGAEVLNSVKCYTDTGTVNVRFTDGTNATNMFNASTTVGTVTMTTNNTWTAGEKRYVEIGTPASSPTSVSCRFDLTVNN